MIPHDVHVTVRPTASLDDTAIAVAASVLSADELARYRRCHFARDARDYAAAHALLRTSLSHHAADRAPADWRFEKTPAGKPLFAGTGNPSLSFSLSHTHGMVACAVTPLAAVGVDVECADRDVDTADIAARFFAPSEAAHLRQLELQARRDRFFDFWTLKEALVKALGAGMAMSLASLAFTVHADGEITLDAPAAVETNRWQFGLFAASPAHRLAVAVQRPAAGAAQLIFRDATAWQT